MQSSTITASMMRKTELLPRCHQTYFKRVDRIESRKEPGPETSMSGMSESAALPQTSTSHDPSAFILSPLSPLQSVILLPFHLMPAPVCQLLYCMRLYDSRYCTVILKTFYFCVFAFKNMLFVWKLL